MLWEDEQHYKWNVNGSREAMGGREAIAGGVNGRERSHFLKALEPSSEVQTFSI